MPSEAPARARPDARVRAAPGSRCMITADNRWGRVSSVGSGEQELAAVGFDQTVGSGRNTRTS
jgi:hypothetical protein